MPDCDFHIILLDKLQAEEIDAVQHIPANQLDIERWKVFSFQYTPFELACAIKPYAMRHLINLGYKRVIYLDADMAIYSRLESVERALDENSVVLTPHLIQPLPLDGGKPDEKLFLTTGAFNGGLVGCRSDGVGRAFLDWWASRLKNDCYVDISRGVFVDQKWLDLVPGLFRNVAILRNPGCNTGYWTLSQFQLSGDFSKGFRVGTEPLECFHFSNFLPPNPYEFMRSQSRVSFDSLPALKELVKNYHEVLVGNHSKKYSAIGCELRFMSDKTLIKPEWREAVRRGYRGLSQIEDPFDAVANPDLVNQFIRIERKASRWRGDWRDCLPSNQAKQQETKRIKNYWKYLRAKLRWS